MVALEVPKRVSRIIKGREVGHLEKRWVWYAIPITIFAVTFIFLASVSHKTGCNVVRFYDDTVVCWNDESFQIMDDNGIREYEGKFTGLRQRQEYQVVGYNQGGCGVMIFDGSEEIIKTDRINQPGDVIGVNDGKIEYYWINGSLMMIKTLDPETLEEKHVISHSMPFYAYLLNGCRVFDGVSY